MRIALYIASLALFLMAGCGTVDTTGENYGDLLLSPAGLEITEAEHPDGWGRADCTVCHNFYNIHLGTVAGIDMAAVRQTVEDDGLSSCVTCHGTNGVQ